VGAYGIRVVSWSMLCQSPPFLVYPGRQFIKGTILTPVGADVGPVVGADVGAAVGACGIRVVSWSMLCQSRLFSFILEDSLLRVVSLPPWVPTWAPL